MTDIMYSTEWQEHKEKHELHECSCGDRKINHAHQFPELGCYCITCEHTKTTQWDKYYPELTPIEAKIKLLLVMQGHNKGDIHFRNAPNNKRYLRLGYWKSLHLKDIEYIERIERVSIEEFSFYDDDCGWKFGYDIIKHIKIKGV